MSTLPPVLTIAGSDSSGGAGIQADLKTMLANGVFGMSAITALTAQNTTGVRAVMDVTPGFLADQIDAVFEDIPPLAVKIGMVSSAALIDVIADRLTFHHAANVVVDPVMVATSGAKLIDDDAITALTERLFPLATLITPNVPEAEVLLGLIGKRASMPSAAAWGAANADSDAADTTNSTDIIDTEGSIDTVDTVDTDAVNSATGIDNLTDTADITDDIDATTISTPNAMASAALTIANHFGCAVLVKGGHAVNDANDVLAEPDGTVTWFDGERVNNPNTHGTGCTLSSAIAANLAKGEPLDDAIRHAKDYLTGALSAMLDLGHGSGPMDHAWRWR